jgi:hypothetical protein
LNDTLWFFWGGGHLTFLRWMTLLSASRVHENVVLVRRDNDDLLQAAEIDAATHWHEHQDFQQRVPWGRNWITEIPASIRQMQLSEVAPEIAAMRAPDVQTSDLLAWWILANHGGTVADMDVLFLRPLPAITDPIHLVVCTGWPMVGYMPIGFLQGAPCQFWRDMYRRARERYNPQVYQSCGATLFPSWEEVPEPKQRLSEHVVYPFALKAEWMQWHIWMFESKEWPAIPDECCGIHWYGGKNQAYNWSITYENVGVMPGAVPAMIRSIADQKALIP